MFAQDVELGRPHGCCQADRHEVTMGGRKKGALEIVRRRSRLALAFSVFVGSASAKI
jgi:hypothetical protein